MSILSSHSSVPPASGGGRAERARAQFLTRATLGLIVLALSLTSPARAIFDKGFDWKDSNHKLKVCLSGAGCPANMSDSLQAAIDLWNAKHLTWTFTLVNDCANADVTVQCGKIDGLGSTETNTGWKKNTTKATVTVNKGANWGWCDDKVELVSTLVHELGHCARLDDTPASDQGKAMRGAQGEAGHLRGPSASDSTEAETSDTARVIATASVPQDAENHQHFICTLTPAPGAPPFNLETALTFHVEPFDPAELQILNWIPLGSNALQMEGFTNSIATPDMELFYLKINYPDSTVARAGTLFVPRSPWSPSWAPLIVAPPDTTVPTDTSRVHLYPTLSLHPGGPVTDMVSFKWVVDQTKGYKFQGISGSITLPAGLHTITLQGRDQAGNEGADSMHVIVLLATEVKPAPETRRDLLVLRLPNPSSAGTPLTLAYAAPMGAEITLRVFDVAGRLIRTLFEGVHPGGERRIVWDLADSEGRKVGAGVYLVSLQAGRQLLTRKAVITK